MLVHAVFEVPDGENIDSRPITEVNYLSIDESGQVTPKTAVAAVTPFWDMSGISLEKFDPAEADVIMFRYNPDEVFPEDAMQIRDILKNEFPNNKVIGLTNDIELLCQNPNEAIDMLNRMIAHIKIVNI